MQGKIFTLIPKVMKQVGAIGKHGFNSFDKYPFRSIDDVYDRLQGPLSDNGVFFVPEVLEEKEEHIQSQKGTDMIRVKMKVRYTFFADDGSSFQTVVSGEAIDRSDKATNKALTAALKYMLIQVFCIAVKDQDDADNESPEIGKPQQQRLDNEWPNFDENTKEEKSPSCPVCGSQMLTSKAGTHWYCPNWKNSQNGQHPTIKKAV